MKISKTHIIIQNEKVNGDRSFKPEGYPVTFKISE